MTLNIAHISDLHIGVSETHDSFIEKQLGNIRSTDIDHLIITGDLTQSGRQDEFQKTVHLLQKYDFLAAEKMTVIPGNHDLFSFFFQDFQLLRDIRTKLHRVPKAARDIYRYNRTNYETDLQRFNDYFHPTFSYTSGNTTSDHSLYPYIKVLNDSAALIALESNQLLPHFKTNALCSNGYIEPETTRKILAHEILQDKTKIVLLHHHLVPDKVVMQRAGRWIASTIKLRNRLEIIEIFKTFKVDLVLHGHYHFNDLYRLPGTNVNVINNGDNRNWSLIRLKAGSFDIIPAN